MMTTKTIGLAVACAWAMAVTLHAGTRTWNGAGGDLLASTPGNWVGNVAPTNNDDIVLDGTSGKHMTWDTNMTAASWTQTAAYTGVVTFLTVYPGHGAFTNFHIAGDCVISNGTWTHQANTGDTLEADRLNVSVGGNLWIGANGEINVDAKGYAAARGPGYSGARQGASYGGEGGMYLGTATFVQPKPPYGSVKAPTSLGSGGQGSRGGGAAILRVDNAAVVNGTISAKGEYSQYNGPGSGGAIFLTAGSLDGGGSLDATGGGAEQRGPGAGGRIAVVLTSGNTFGLVAMRAPGSTCVYVTGSSGGTHSAAGTVYRRTQAGFETLVIDNNNVPPNGTRSATFLPPDQAYNLNTDFDEVVITNRGVLGVNTNTSVDLGALGHFNCAGAGNAFLLLRETNKVTVPVPLVLTNKFTLLLEHPLVVNGDVNVAAGSGLGQGKNLTNAVYSLDLTVNGDLTIASGAEIDVTGFGYQSGYGPGAPGGNNQGAGHGGLGAEKYWPSTIRSHTYGSIVAPTDLGSGADGWSGGGAVRLAVSGQTALSGDIIARGDGHIFRGSGSGGSVFITTGTMTGGGTIDASGGNEGDASGQASAGGGRIAVVLTAGEDTGSVSMKAYGGWGHNRSGTQGSAPGTVYRSFPVGGPTCLIGNNRTVFTNYWTHFPPQTNVTAGIAQELRPVTVVVTNQGRLQLTEDTSVGNLFLAHATAYVDLNYKTLTIRSAEHALSPGTVTNYGAIVWVPTRGSVVTLR